MAYRSINFFLYDVLHVVQNWYTAGKPEMGAAPSRTKSMGADGRGWAPFLFDTFLIRNFTVPAVSTHFLFFCQFGRPGTRPGWLGDLVSGPQGVDPGPRGGAFEGILDPPK